MEMTQTLCVCMRACTYVCLSVLACAHRSRSQCWLSSLNTFYLLREGTHLSLKLASWLNSLASKSPELPALSPWPLPSSYRVTGSRCHTSLFIWVLEILTQVSKPVGDLSKQVSQVFRHCTAWAMSPDSSLFSVTSTPMTLRPRSLQWTQQHSYCTG